MVAWIFGPSFARMHSPRNGATEWLASSVQGLKYHPPCHVLSQVDGSLLVVAENVMGHMVPADHQQPQQPPGQWAHTTTSQTMTHSPSNGSSSVDPSPSPSSSNSSSSNPSRSNGSLASSLDLYRCSCNAAQVRSAKVRSRVAAAAAGTSSSSSDSSSSSKYYTYSLAAADYGEASSASYPPHALPAVPGSSRGSACGQKLAYSNQCGRVHLMNVKVQNVGVDWHLSGGGAWKHQVQRHEACRVILYGRSEFEAYDCVISGNQVRACVRG